MKKRVICILLSLLLVVGLSRPAWAATTSGGFGEVVRESNARLLAARTNSPIMPDIKLSQAVIDKSNEIVGDETDDYQKLYLIVKWVSNNISYDYQMESRLKNLSLSNYGSYSEYLNAVKAMNAAQEPDIVLRDKKAVCDGYTNLCQALTVAQNIPCYYTLGYALGTGTTGVWDSEAKRLGVSTPNDFTHDWGSDNNCNHAWNEAYVNGRWVIFDATWGEFDYSVEAFSKKHMIYPEEYELTLVQFPVGDGYDDHYIIFDKLTGCVLDTSSTYIYSAVIPSSIENVSVISINEKAFIDCSRMQSISLPEGLLTIGNRAFENCKKLSVIHFPDSLVSIGEKAFEKCTGLTEIRFSDSPTSIGERAFYGCTSLNNLQLSDSLISVGSNAFTGCASLAEVTLFPNIEYGEGVFSGCGLTKVAIPDGMTAIPNGMFAGCLDLKSVTIPSSVRSIEDYAFSGCRSLGRFVIPDTVTSIGDSAFDIWTRYNYKTLMTDNPHDTLKVTIVILGTAVTLGETVFGFGYADLEMFGMKLWDMATDTEITTTGRTIVEAYSGSTAETYLKASGAEYPIFKSLGQAPEEVPFDDVPADSWYYNSVKQAYKTGLINGTSETTFSPRKNMRLCEAVKLAATIHQYVTTGKVTLTNGTSVWYSTYVDYAMKHGIINQTYSAEQMNKAVTRGDFAAIFARALPENKLVDRNTIYDNALPDVKKGDANYDSIYKLYRAGILNGSDSAGTFYPDSYITRDAIAAIVVRMVDAGQRVDAPANLAK